MRLISLLQEFYFCQLFINCPSISFFEYPSNFLLNLRTKFFSTISEYLLIILTHQLSKEQIQKKMFSNNNTFSDTTGAHTVASILVVGNVYHDLLRNYSLQYYCTHTQTRLTYNHESHNLVQYRNCTGAGE